MEGTHREIVGAGLVSSELLTKVGEGEEAADAVEALLVLPVATLDLAVMPGRVRADEFVTYVQGSGGGFKERMGIAR